MLTAAFVSFICCILQLVPVISTSSDGTTIANTHWIRGEGDFVDGSGAQQGITMYVSLTAFTLKADNGTVHTVKWNDVSCNISQCDTCKDATSDTVLVASMSFLTSLGQLATDIQRSTITGDLNCQRTLGIATAVFGFLTTMMSLRIFMQDCGDEFVSDITFGDGTRIINTKYRWGVSAICLLTATLLKTFDMGCHLAIPTPSLKHEKDADRLFGLSEASLQTLLEESGGHALDTRLPRQPQSQQHLDRGDPAPANGGQTIQGLPQFHRVSHV
jgi:hypothetical protein